MTSHAPPPARSARTFDVTVMTTAALPWRTGPAYLSLRQAAGLAGLGLRVAYLAPWVGARGQARLWGAPTFASRQDHAAWLADQARAMGCAAAPEIFHYRGYASNWLRSIAPLEDVFGAAPPSRAIVMAEPEHLCWFPFTRPRAAVEAETVCGLVMTNYAAYVRRQAMPGSGLLADMTTRRHRHLIRRHTDWVAPLSPAVAEVAAGHPTRTERLTGVLSDYATVPPVRPETRGAYFLGRLVWDKGLAAVIEAAGRMDLAIDIFGDGPDGAAIREMAQARGAPVRFLGPSAAPWTWLEDYRVFFNPSLSEVLCTATADALVAGRHVVLADCPANEPFKAYPNVHVFTDMAGAIAALEHAMREAPAPPDAVRRDFDWDLACRRLAGLIGADTSAGP